MTAKEIIINYLKANGYDGLCGEECGCEFDDLIACDDRFAFDCVPGYKIKCMCGGGCDWDMSPHKEGGE
jgi:hypothetical protein